MAINLASKFSQRVAERFTQQSITERHASGEYSFEGVKTVKVYSVDTVPLQDYSRTGTSRYGDPTELGDTVQELTMGQDRAFTYTIDKGNDREQLNIKAATKSLRRQVDEVVIPELDGYRLGVWCRDAGTITGVSAAPTSDTIVGLVMDATEVLDNANVPQDGRTLFITAAMYKVLKQNPDFLSNDKLGESALAKGVVGEIDGMKVIKVPAGRLPTGVYFLVTHKSSVLAPAKLQDYKVHKDPPGINGDLVEGRLLHDAFVLGARNDGVYCLAASANVTAAPTVTDTDGVWKATATTDMKYTVDGTDPRTSSTAKVWTGNIDYEEAGYTTLKVYAVGDESTGMLPSAVVTAE